MYFENKKNYYRFPSKASTTEYDAQIPYYFPTNDNFGSVLSKDKAEAHIQKENSIPEPVKNYYDPTF